jgi:hypothetical protein
LSEENSTWAYLSKVFSLFLDAKFMWFCLAIIPAMSYFIAFFGVQMIALNDRMIDPSIPEG